jgi:hypothetical protein
VLAVLLDSNAPGAERVLSGVEEVRRSIGMRIEIVRAGAEHELEPAFETIVKACLWAKAGQQPAAEKRDSLQCRKF